MTRWKDLTKRERKHLNAMGLRTLKDFKHNAELQAEMRKKFPTASEPCWDCRHIAVKLGVGI